MKIIEEYNLEPIIEIAIKSAKYIDKFKIEIVFSDGTQKIVDFKHFLEKVIHPSIRKYLDEAAFTQWNIVDGNLNWNDYELIFPIEDLYEGRIS